MAVAHNAELVDAEADFLTFHIPARLKMAGGLVHAEIIKRRITGLFCCDSRR